MAKPAASTRATIGCLDLAITPEPHAVLAYEVGNRCDYPAIVDLPRRVVGHDVDGQVRDLVAFDPQREIRPAWLDGRASARERIEYPTDVGLVDVCLDVAAITHAAPAMWLCVRTEEGS